MMQKSVYSKLALNNVTSKVIKDRLRQNVPPDGLVEILEITENQFSSIEYLLGQNQSNVEDSMDRLVEV